LNRRSPKINPEGRIKISSPIKAMRSACDVKKIIPDSNARRDNKTEYAVQQCGSVPMTILNVWLNSSASWEISPSHCEPS
jgi:hypothetical protein